MLFKSLDCTMLFCCIAILDHVHPSFLTEQCQTYIHEDQFLFNLEGRFDTCDSTYPKVVLILLT